MELERSASSDKTSLDPIDYVPEGLWHGVLFYLSGSATREGLAAEGVEHNLLMHDEKIFSAYHEALSAGIPDYIAGDVSLDEAMLKVMKVLQPEAR